MKAKNKKYKYDKNYSKQYNYNKKNLLILVCLKKE